MDRPKKGGGTAKTTTKRLSIEVGDASVSAVLIRPPRARALYVLAHGAGAGMDHPVMLGIARALSRRGVATLRFQFPYMEAGKKRPDPPTKLAKVTVAVVERAGAMGLPVFAGGKSMGGRIAAECAARGEIEVRGLIFLGFPLHAAKAPNAERAWSIRAVKSPMLFLQGTRDALADLTLLRPIVKKTKATLHEVEGGDHSFAVPKKSGRTAEQIWDELSEVTSDWIDSVL
jgi:predicted alpha/beta-hydrolase family hydrolase